MGIAGFVSSTVSLWPDRGEAPTAGAQISLVGFLEVCSILLLLEA